MIVEAPHADDQPVWVFPGQGAQYPLMAAQPPVLREILESWREPLAVDFNFDLDVMLHEQRSNELDQDATAQTAVYLVSVAMVHSLQTAGLRPWSVVGYSSGLYAALNAADCLDWRGGLTLTIAAGSAIERFAPDNGAVAAIVGLATTEIERLCGEVSAASPLESPVMVSHRNEPCHVLIAGGSRGVTAVMEQAVARGAKLVKKLPMNRAYHTRLLEPASTRFNADVMAMPFRVPRCLVLNYCDVAYCSTIQALQRLTGDHFTRPVYWQAVIELLIRDGAKWFIEVGPGRGLGRMITRLDRSVRVTHAEDLLKRRR